MTKLLNNRELYNASLVTNAPYLMRASDGYICKVIMHSSDGMPMKLQQINDREFWVKENNIYSGHYTIPSNKDIYNWYQSMRTKKVTFICSVPPFPRNELLVWVKDMNKELYETIVKLEKLLKVKDNG